LVAMFNRVAGGNYTKAADISAGILGKIRMIFLRMTAGFQM